MLVRLLASCVVAVASKVLCFLVTYQENSLYHFGAIIECARVCSRVLLDWRFFPVPFLAYLFTLLRLRYAKVPACVLLV